MKWELIDQAFTNGLIGSIILAPKNKRALYIELFTLYHYKRISRHIVKSNKGKKELKDFPNLVLKNMHIDKPFMVVVSDMTAFSS